MDDPKWRQWKHIKHVNSKRRGGTRADDNVFNFFVPILFPVGNYDTFPTYTFESVGNREYVSLTL